MAAPTSSVPFSLAEGSDPHEPPFNTPAKRAQTSEIWTKKMAMRIRGETGRAQALRTQGYTHVCVLKLANGSPCNHALKITKGQSGTWHLAHHGLKSSAGLTLNPRVSGVGVSEGVGSINV